MTVIGKNQGSATAVLTSGGVESTVLLIEGLKRYERVYPIYVRKGFVWEMSELYWIRQLLKALRCDGLADLAILDVPIGALYAERHWGLGTLPAPGNKAPDRSVYLPGRNLLLLTVGGLFCALRRIPNLWIGILKGNPFHDARSGFFRQIEGVIQEAVGVPVRIAAPLKEMTKREVLRCAPQLPWRLTFSCIRPKGRRHCGRCQKCAERQAGFRAAGLHDPTRYAG
jgi:7-cyano-7-deazaguanine synthase